MPEPFHASATDIALCPSTPHRNILGLVRAALGRPVDEALVEALATGDPEDLVRIAVFNYVHVVLAGAFDHRPDLARAVPKDLVIFAHEMRTANVKRNQAIHRQLLIIGAALSRGGIQGVALKGSAELLAPVFPDPAYRFLSDVDILVAEHDLESAVAAVRALGAIAQNREASDKQAVHHYWPLHHRDWPVPVELHFSLGHPTVNRALAAEEILARRVLIEGSGLGVPYRAHRMAHSVLHAQLSIGNFANRQLSLRDALEFEVFANSLAEMEISQAREIMTRANLIEAWDALQAASHLVFGDRNRFEAAAPAARAWAEAAIVNFGRPNRNRATAMLRWTGQRAGDFIADSEQRRRYLHLLARPSRLKKALALHLEQWRRMR